MQDQYRDSNGPIPEQLAQTRLLIRANNGAWFEIDV